MQAESAVALNLKVLDIHREGRRFVIVLEPDPADVDRLERQGYEQAFGVAFKSAVRHGVEESTAQFLKLLRESVLMERTIKDVELERAKLDNAKVRAKIELVGDVLMRRLVEIDKEDAQLAARIEMNKAGLALLKNEVKQGLDVALKTARYVGRNFVETTLPGGDAAKQEMLAAVCDAIAGPMTDFIQQDHAQRVGKAGYERPAERVVEETAAVQQYLADEREAQKRADANAVLNPNARYQPWDDKLPG